MSEKINELNEQNAVDVDESVTQEELDASSGKVSFEENDNWTFEAEAPTLSLIEDNMISEITPPMPKTESPKEDEPEPQPPVAKVEQKVPVSKNDKIMFTLTALIIVVLIALLAFLGVRYYTVPNSDEKMNPGNVAVTIDGTKVSLGLYNYYYTLASQEYISGAGSYYDIDASKDFTTQITEDEDGNKITWHEMFQKSALERMKADITNYNKAVERGLELTKAQKKEINNAIDSLKETASQSEMSIDQYLSENYGEHCGIATIKKLLNQYYLAQLYVQISSVDQKITDEELDAYSKAHLDDYKQVKIAYLPITFEVGDEDAANKAVEDAKKYVKGIKTEDDMKLLIPKVWKDMIDQYVEAGYYDSEEACILDIASNMEADIAKNTEGFIDEAIDWLFDDKTKVNDVDYFLEKEDGVLYIFMKLSAPSFDESKVYSVRHILIAPEAEQSEEEEESQSQPTYTDEQWDAAAKKAQTILDKYNAGDKTEMAFAVLAEENSTDTGSISSGGQNYGGLYAGVPLGQMVKPFENWAIDESRKYGDVDIVKTDFGYHIMFFVDNTESYKYQLKQSAIAEKEGASLDEAKIKVSKHALKISKVAQPVSEQE